MKNVKNSNFADRDLNVGGRTYTGDAHGVFAMDDDHADKVLGMRGWALSEVVPETTPNFDPVRALRETVVDAAPKPPAPSLSAAPTVRPQALPPAQAEQPAPEPDPEPQAPESAPDEAESAVTEDGDEEVGPDLDSMTTKQALFDVAKEYGVKLTSIQKKQSVDEIRAILEQEIYGESEG